MGEFSPPTSPAKTKRSKVSQCLGIFGPRNQVIKQANARGFDISNFFCNDISDLYLGKKGVMELRAGFRKILNTGHTDTIHGIIFIRIGNSRKYGVKHGTTLDVIDLPEWTDKAQDSFVFDPVPDTAAITNEYPLADPSAFQ